MLFKLGLISRKCHQSQMFESLLLLTVIYMTNANPVNRKDFESLLDSAITEEQAEKELILSNIKQKILARLNYTVLPKFKKTFDWKTIPEEMKLVLDQEVMSEDRLSSDSLSKINVTVITTLTKLNSCNINNPTSNNKQCLNLKLPDLYDKEIVNAKLILPLKKSVLENFLLQGQINYIISVNEQVELNSDLLINDSSTKSVAVEWTHVLKSMLHDDDSIENIGISPSWTVSITGTDHMAPVNQIIDLYKVILEIVYKEVPKPVRRKRSVNTCQSNQFFCCMEILKVSIEDLGWSDFILAPRTFTINFCRGDCNNFVANSSNHARALHHAQNKRLENRKLIRSCCVPYSYKTLTIMYLKPDNTLAMAYFYDLIADTCGCM